jgi:MFS family permease
MISNTEDSPDLPLAGEGEIFSGPVKDSEKLLPLRALLTRPVVVSVANYCVIGLQDVIAEAVIPLVWSTSIEFGGLGMNPASIGLWMAGYGFMNGVFQFFAFPRIVRRFGPRRIFIASILCFFPVYITLPFENLALRHSSRGLNPAAALLIVLQLSSISFADMGFGESPSTSLCVRSLK